MERFEYSGLLLLFLLPSFWGLFKRFGGNRIKKQAKLIVTMAIFGGIGYFIVFPLGANWTAWGYDYMKTWNIRIGADLLETFFWSIAGCIILAILVGCYADQIEKRKVFRKRK